MPTIRRQPLCCFSITIPLIGASRGLRYIPKLVRVARLQARRAAAISGVLAPSA